MLPAARLLELTRTHGTPLWIYDAEPIRRRIAQLRQFDVIRYAQKANANTHLLRWMRDQGVAVDAVSQGEILRSLAAGYDPRRADELVFTADVIDRATLHLVRERQITVNVGSLDMLAQLGRQVQGTGHKVWLRINPGFGHGHSAKTNTGGEHSKHGLWLSDLPRALALVRHYQLDLVGLHMHIGSGVDYAHLARVCQAMVSTVRERQADLHSLRAISAGGGLPVPYQEQEQEIDTQHYFNLWDQARQEIATMLGRTIQLEIEPGRFLVAQAGTLVGEVLAVKDTPSHRFAIVDAGFNDLVRPAFYGSHHRMSVLATAGAPANTRPIADIAVAGPLCEAGDVFTQLAGGTIVSRSLPQPQPGDLMLFHDAGAYGAAMSSNYNSRPLAPEVWVDGDEVRLIRRRQTLTELLALEQT